MALRDTYDEHATPARRAADEKRRAHVQRIVQDETAIGVLIAALHRTRDGSATPLDAHVLRVLLERTADGSLDEQPVRVSPRRWSRFYALYNDYLRTLA